MTPGSEMVISLFGLRECTGVLVATLCIWMGRVKSARAAASRVVPSQGPRPGTG